MTQKGINISKAILHASQKVQVFTSERINLGHLEIMNPETRFNPRKASGQDGIGPRRYKSAKVVQRIGKSMELNSKVPEEAERGRIVALSKIESSTITNLGQARSIVVLDQIDNFRQKAFREVDNTLIDYNGIPNQAGGSTLVKIHETIDHV
jgi:hypothetical protein